MAQSPVALSAGDQRDAVASRAPHGHLSPSTVALAMISGDSPLVAAHRAPPAPPPAPPAPPPAPPAPPPPRPSLRPEHRRRAAAGGGRPPTRLFKEPEARGRSRRARFSPYAPAGVQLDLLRTVLERRLRALGGA